MLYPLLLLLAHAKPVPKVISPPRVYIPDDADPCDFERFKTDPYLGDWIRQTSPNTATQAKCYHSAPKLLPVLSGLLADLDHGRAKLEGGAKFDLRAAALTGYQVDSMIEVTREGVRSVGLVFKSGVNGPAAAQVYVKR